MKLAPLCMLLLLTFIIASQCQTPPPTGGRGRYKKKDGNLHQAGRPGPAQRRIQQQQRQRQRQQHEANIRHLSACVGECHPQQQPTGCSPGCICRRILRGLNLAYQCTTDIADSFS
uniref:Putative secreted protein n=1 Tax=Amblyomma parvum TaxID=251391 RepID=A0A023G051_AMBPA